MIEILQLVTLLLGFAIVIDEVRAIKKFIRWE